MLQLKSYKGYEGYVRSIDPEDNVIAGRVAGIRDVVSFVGSTPAELQQEFERSINEYLAVCAEQGKRPDKPASGTFQVRVGPDLHRKAAMFAESRHKSLNAVVVEALEALVKV